LRLDSTIRSSPQLRVIDGHASAVLAASIFHFGEYTIRQAKERMAEAGIAMRMD